MVSLLRGEFGRDLYDGDGPCAYCGSYCVHDVSVQNEALLDHI